MSSCTPPFPPAADATVTHAPYATLLQLAQQALQRLGLSEAHAQAMARTIAAGQRDDCQSHGLYRLLTCTQTVRAGKVNLQAEPVIQASASAVVRIDAKMAFSPLAFERGAPLLVAAARRHGLGALVINRCFHFSALWPEIEMLTAEGLAVLAMTPSHAWVAPTGGSQPVFGTNPIAFGWPRPGRAPYVFDLATSAIARGDLELHRQAGTALPEGCGVDRDGQPSTDPFAVAQGAPCAPLADTRARRSPRWSNLWQGYSLATGQAANRCSSTKVQAWRPAMANWCWRSIRHC